MNSDSKVVFDEALGMDIFLKGSQVSWTGRGIIKAGSFLLGKYKHSMENTASETSASTSLLNINEDRVMIPRIDCLDWR